MERVKLDIDWETKSTYYCSRMRDLVEVINEIDFANITRKTLDDSYVEDSDYYGFVGVEGCNQYVFSDISIDMVKSDFIASVKAKLKKITDKHGGINRYGDFIIGAVGEDSDNTCVYVKLSLVDREV